MVGLTSLPALIPLEVARPSLFAVGSGYQGRNVSLVLTYVPLTLLCQRQDQNQEN